VIIDAIFGTGLNRPVEGIAAEVIAKMNASGSTLVSIDLPSGLFASDNTTNDLSAVVRADYLLSFQLPKLAFYLEETSPFTGEIHLLDIGLHRDFIDSVEAEYHLLTEVNVKLMRRPRAKFAHKGNFGHLLLIAGARGKRGASLLSAGGALRAGAGLLTLHTDAEGAMALHQQYPEAMVSFDEKDHHWTSLPPLDGYNAVAVGPGIGTHADTARVLKLLIQEAKTPLVLDADALNILAENPTWLSFLPKGSILTPHPGEFARIAGEKLPHYQRIQVQRELSRKHGIYILLKGGHSTLSLPDGQVLINNTGNPGMATGGMGDVLTGIIGGLLASGYPPMESAALGMFIHGLGGDLALKNSSVEALLPTDLIKYLGNAFQSL
jgi:NAD(P)H-hydrate epimerase